MFVRFARSSIQIVVLLTVSIRLDNDSTTRSAFRIVQSIRTFRSFIRYAQSIGWGVLGEGGDETAEWRSLLRSVAMLAANRKCADCTERLCVCVCVCVRIYIVRIVRVFVCLTWLASLSSCVVLLLID
jgi:hypothetical protein